MANTTKSQSWNWRRVACVVCAVALVVNGQNQAYAVDGASSVHESTSSSGHGSSVVPWLVIGAAILAAGAVALSKHAKATNALENDASLLENGPRLPDAFTVGTFAVQGYAQSGWPMVIDFQPKPNTCTWLEISVGGKWYYGRIIDVDGQAGRRFIRLDLPDGVPTATPAMYVIHSATPACPPGTPPQHIASPVEVYGIGAGPRAVGSVAINQLEFGPSSPHFPNEQAAIAYHAGANFNRAKVEVLRFESLHPGQIDVKVVHVRPSDPVGLGKHAEMWDGTDLAGHLSRGLHRLQVRAWFTGSDDKSWVGAISPASVKVSGQ
ncbi:hypothetical protein [Burkholderia ubonensis]|uniref:hypothetical protein n=1 Tax=Burkholderia ubonensis TaxID=101571 RepID=UPI000B0B9C99|nr:hypothetical protein [Burkholderia ubonensis]